LAGAVISFQTDVTPQPAPPQPAHLAFDPTELGLLSAGQAISLHGFAGAQPFSPQGACVVSEAFGLELQQSLLAGQSITGRGFAPGRLPEAPPQYLVALPPELQQLASLLEGSSISLRGEVLGQRPSPLAALIVSTEPPPLAALAGAVQFGRGAPPDRYDAPAATLYVVAPAGEEHLQPAGRAIHGHGFAVRSPTVVRLLLSSRPSLAPSCGKACWAGRSCRPAASPQDWSAPRPPHTWRRASRRRPWPWLGPSLPPAGSPPRTKPARRRSTWRPASRRRWTRWAAT
jgi:hypothetical protein